jgi:hypothetical protein
MPEYPASESSPSLARVHAHSFTFLTGGDLDSQPNSVEPQPDAPRASYTVLGMRLSEPAARGWVAFDSRGAR